MNSARASASKTRAGAGRKTVRKTAKKAKSTRKATKKAVRKSAGRKTARKATRKTARKTARPSAAAIKARALERQEAEEYQQALSAYAVCMKLLQKHDWRQASRALADFVASHTRERELNERARMYLRVCRQHLDVSDEKAESFDDHCFLAVLLANDGDHAGALAHLKKALAERPDSDKATYLRASTLALKGDRRGALDALQRAIELNDRNRIYATHNPDFANLRDDEEFITLTTREDEEL